MRHLKKHLSSIVLSLIFVIGLGLLLYPTVANWWNNTIASHAVAVYDEAIANMSNEDYQKLIDEARDYNKALEDSPTGYKLDDEQYSQYRLLLSTQGSDIIGTIHIPSVKIDLPILHGTSEATLQAGAGHLEGSSMPVEGLGTHAVITGHRGLPSAKLFTDLDKVVDGDYIILNILNETLTYLVDDIRIVEPKEVDSLRIVPEEDLLTLVTCTPYGINSHRILITGHRVENLSGDYNGAFEARLLDTKIVALFIAVPILIGLFIWLLIRYRKPKDEEEN